MPVFQQITWLMLREDALLRNGWQRVHPMVPGRLVDPGAIADPTAYTELRAML